MAPIRQSFEHSGISYSELARRLGWTRIVPDRWRVRRTLGYSTATPAALPREWLNYDLAREMCDAVGGDYFHCGI